MRYKQTESADLHLHVFTPKSHMAEDRRAAVVFFFGGGWINGAVTQFYPQSMYLASRGMVAICADYRVESRHHTSPRECVNDGKSAIRWVRSHAHELGINPVQIVAGGGSAGAHIAAATAFVDGFDDPCDDVSVSCVPDALILFNPVLDNGPDGYGYERVRSYWREFSPFHNLSAKAPPTLIMSGTADNLVSSGMLREYAKRMSQHQCRCDLVLYDNQPHGFFNISKYYETLQESDRFLVSLGFISDDCFLPNVVLNAPSGAQILPVIREQVLFQESSVFCRDLDPLTIRTLFPVIGGLHLSRVAGMDEFTEGVDYSQNCDGSMRILSEDRIPVLDYYRDIGDSDLYRFKDSLGKWFYSPPENFKHDAYDISVSYTCERYLVEALFAGAWATCLVSIAEQLRGANSSFHVTFFGDSITAGLQASDASRTAYAPLVIAGLQQCFPSTHISFANPSDAGKTSEWGLQNISIVTQTNPDLVVLAFGMNDGSSGIPSDIYKKNMQAMIHAVRRAKPAAGIILVAEFLPNPDWEDSNYSLRTKNRDALSDLYSNNENISFVDVGSVSRRIAMHKKIQDMTGNCLNHPNDFLHWIYAQLILRVLLAEQTNLRFISK